MVLVHRPLIHQIRPVPLYSLAFGSSGRTWFSISTFRRTYTATKSIRPPLVSRQTLNFNSQKLNSHPSYQNQHQYYSTQQSSTLETEENKEVSKPKEKVQEWDQTGYQVSWIRDPVAVEATDDAYGRAFNNNSKWRRSLAETDPELFKRLGKGQAPQILWIGCADSRCPETTILGLQPGEIFCHRNIANILVPTDLCSLSVIQYAVQYLKVKHIIICGHTSCGGVAAALDNKKLGLIDTWLMPLRTLRQENLQMLESLDEKERALRLVELNVRSGVKVLNQNPSVIDAMAERELQIHGLVYDVGTGELRELDVGEDEELTSSRKTAFQTQ